MATDSVTTTITEEESIDFQSFDFDSCLKLYYNKLFPFKELVNWLSYGNEKDYFLRREFSFTFKGDHYARFRSYPDLDSLSKDIKKGLPYKIDIGAVYNVSPRDKLSYGSAFVAKEKELVFDIDMSDYNPIRTCCTGTSICQKCWPWMTVSIKVIDHILREDFGFSHLLWVFSGRRGVHCWVCDKRARLLSPEAREAIADYISVISGGEGKSRKVQLGATLHPTLRKLYERVLLPWFEQSILVHQGVLATEESQQKVLAAIPDQELRSAIAKEWQDNDTSPEAKWADLKATIEDRMKDKKKQFGINPIFDIVFTYTYPRLDVNVSTGLNHLLKSPFCVHPSTGRVCVPIDPKTCENFTPTSVPSVQELIKEIDSWKPDPSNTDAKKLKDYKKTKLAGHITAFKQSFLRPLQEAAKQEQLQRAMAKPDLSF